MFELLTVVFWAITYILIIFSGFQSKEEQKIAMPYVAGVLNFAWEVCALYQSRGFWGHVIWVVLDLGIIYFGFRYARSVNKRILYAISLLVSIGVLMYVFEFAMGELYSVFIIDIIMALWFIIDFKQISSKLKIQIAVTKMLGDLFAGIECAAESYLVCVLAVLVFVCNLFYLSMCLEETKFFPSSGKKSGKKGKN